MLCIWRERSIYAQNVSEVLQIQRIWPDICKPILNKMRINVIFVRNPMLGKHTWSFTWMCTLAKSPSPVQYVPRGFQIPPIWRNMSNECMVCERPMIRGITTLRTSSWQMARADFLKEIMMSRKKTSRVFLLQLDRNLYYLFYEEIQPSLQLRKFRKEPTHF